MRWQKRCQEITNIAVPQPHLLLSSMSKQVTDKTADGMRWQKRCQATGVAALMKSNATSEILTRRMKGLSSPIRKRPPRKSREHHTSQASVAWGSEEISRSLCEGSGFTD